MTNTQITLVQIDNYGPWTTTPEPRREVDLQTLQSRLYADISQLVGNRGGYAFFARFDNMVTITNGLDTDEHALIQESIRNRYPVTASFSVATDPSPARALETASGQLQAAGSAQDAGRTEILRGETLSDSVRADDDIQMAHFDVADVTGKYTDRLDAFETFIKIEQGYAELMRYMWQEHDSLSFFVGGDNIITVCPGLSESAYRDAVAHCREAVDVDLRVGVGRARTAQGAGMTAKHALEACREEEIEVEIRDAGERVFQ